MPGVWHDNAHHDLPFTSEHEQALARRFGRVYPSPQYRAWVTEAGRELRAQRSKSVTGPVAVTIAAGRQDRRPRDIDNLGKASLDLLVEHRVLADDSQITDFRARWCDALRPVASS